MFDFRQNELPVTPNNYAGHGSHMPGTDWFIGLPCPKQSILFYSDKCPCLNDKLHGPLHTIPMCYFPESRLSSYSFLYSVISNSPFFILELFHYLQLTFQNHEFFSADWALLGPSYMCENGDRERKTKFGNYGEKESLT